MTKREQRIVEDVVRECLVALVSTQQMMDKSHSQFNWGMSALDAESIALLNVTPGLVSIAIAKACAFLK